MTLWGQRKRMISLHIGESNDLERKLIWEYCQLLSELRYACWTYNPRNRLTVSGDSLCSEFNHFNPFIEIFLFILSCKCCVAFSSCLAMWNYAEIHRKSNCHTHSNDGLGSHVSHIVHMVYPNHTSPSAPDREKPETKTKNKTNNKEWFLW